MATIYMQMKSITSRQLGNGSEELAGQYLKLSQTNIRNISEMLHFQMVNIILVKLAWLHPKLQKLGLILWVMTSSCCIEMHELGKWDFLFSFYV